MKSQYELTPLSSLGCKKDTLCEKTSDYMEALATAEFKLYKMTRKVQQSQLTIRIKDNEIQSLRNTLAKQVEYRFKEIERNLEIAKLKNQVNELLEFKEHYEQMLQEMEKEIQIDQEIDHEIGSMAFKKEPIADIDAFIKENLFLTKEEYEKMTSG